MQVGFIGLGSQGAPDGAADHRGRLPDDTVGTQTRDPRAVCRHPGEGRRDHRPNSPPTATWSACASSATPTSTKSPAVSTDCWPGSNRAA